MAQCDTGYFCRVCGEYVESIAASELYLRYVMGRVEFPELLNSPDAHIWCNANLAQYITDPKFKPPAQNTPRHDKRDLDPRVRAEREELASRAWRRLQEVVGLGLSVDQYPLPDAGSGAATAKPGLDTGGA